jgi:signal transduction histidine kinase
MHARDSSPSGDGKTTHAGQLAELIRARDWSDSPLGPAVGWGSALQGALNLSLVSRFPFAIAWGSEETLLYNDGYRSVVGAEHPRALGRSFRELWRSAWPVVGDAFERAKLGHAAFLEDRRVFIERNGFLEEAFFTFSFSPIYDGERVGGVLQTLLETTGKVLRERRTGLLRDLATASANASSGEDALLLIARTLAGATLDVPFAFVYMVDDLELRLLSRATASLSATIAPSRIELSQDDPWGLAEVARSGLPGVNERLVATFGELRLGPYPEPPRQALLLPIKPHGVDAPVAVLVAGVSARLPFDEEYRAFYEHLSSTVTTCVASALAHEQQRRRAEQLAELDRTKTAFFANVSHEFRTPLTLITGPLEDELDERDEPLPTHRRERLETVQRNALRLLKLVNVLLEFSRIEAGRVLASYQPTDLATLTSELASMFRSAVERTRLSLDLELDALPEPVFVDRDMWEKIVLNLMSNAFKHTFEGGIRVRLRSTEAAVELAVSDTGVGIAEGELPHLFERFHRVLGAQSRTHEGSGIGLALARELARLHGGDIRVESQVNQGTTFSVSIPRGSAHLPPAHVSHDSSQSAVGVGALAYVHEALQWSKSSLEGSAPETAERSRSRLPRVLLADDNADMRDYVSRLLAPLYEVRAVPDGQAALDLVPSWEPELILTDVMMPRLDGIALLKAVRGDRATQQIPVILLSARASEDASVAGLETGADDYLVKPFSARELLARVRTHLSLSKIRRDWAEHLQQVNQELEAFSYSVSHDLRTPLRAIDGFSKALLSRNAAQLDDDGKLYLTRIRAAAGRMSELIDELLRLSRVSRSNVVWQNLDLTQLILRVASERQPHYPQQKVALWVEPDLRVRADARLLQILLENLLDNAFKFTSRRAEPEVRVGQVPDAEPQTFYVEDNGAGFASEYGHKLFQPFQRLHTERDFPGTGVGLAIVSRIASRHGGRAWAESKEGEGAKFYFTLQARA